MNKGTKFTEEHKKNLSKSHLGQKSWSKGKTRLTDNRIGQPWLGKKRPNVSGVNNYLWKGDDVKYRGLHMWVESKLGKPLFCEHCKKSDLPHRSYNWANKSHKYKRDVNDWIRLCVKCHKKYDTPVDNYACVD